MKPGQFAKFWIINARYHAAAQSLLPALLAICLAAGREDFSPALAILAVCGVEFGHLGINLFDDYFDYRRRPTCFRDAMAREGIRARIAKCPYLTSGATTIGHLLAASVIFCVLALATGAIIFLQRGEPVLWLAAAMAVLGLEYSGRPLKLSYRGLGEIEIGVVFGPMLMNGVFFSACGKFNPEVLLLSIPVGLLVMNIVYSHAIMDLEPDKRVGKMTLAVLAGSAPARLMILGVLLGLPYVLVGLAAAFKLMSPAFLLVWLTFPLAAILFKLMLQYTSDPARPVVRRFWMGPMNRWESVRANGIEWFMVRWYLARNLMLFFCLTAMAACVF
jgi:1,4-dihydroxy-2-naphthoate octaprenyltransferase